MNAQEAYLILRLAVKVLDADWEPADPEDVRLIKEAYGLTGTRLPLWDRSAVEDYLEDMEPMLRESSPASSKTCHRCPHAVNLHDREGCTVTISQTDDPDFGPTQTCPCCEKRLS